MYIPRCLSKVWLCIILFVISYIPQLIDKKSQKLTHPMAGTYVSHTSLPCWDLVTLVGTQHSESYKVRPNPKHDFTM
jgi:hypothetical protein